jgi:dTDP-4-dehydrorhamnose 3,5-epimerase
MTDGTVTAGVLPVGRRAQSVTPDGQRIEPLIGGVKVRHAVTQTDARGTVCEVYDPRWNFTGDPLIYVYQITIRPGVTKGWQVHKKYEDRLFFSSGTAKVVLYDDREGSDTRGMINELFFDDHSRGLLRIPAGVWHAVGNVGLGDVLMVNCPSRPYDHGKPDKWDLPLDTDQIPYAF